MSVSLYKITKWIKMLSGISPHHVNQDEGKIYSKNKVEGYYNNLTEKITRFGRSDNSIPLVYVDNGNEIEFSIAIFQYGLAAYDLYLLSNKIDRDSLSKMKSCAEWAVTHQQMDGSWITFEYENQDCPYSSMAQGEGISLLIRAYITFGDERYRVSAIRALDFMLLPIEKGGTTKYCGKDIYLYEYPNGSLVLNGWIFSIWGLFDYWKFTNDERIKEIFNLTLLTLEKKIPSFDSGYWSKYDDNKRIASPFYHKLHIAQLRVMYDLTGKDIYKSYADRWERFSDNWLYSKIAFVKKTFQKILE